MTNGQNASVPVWWYFTHALGKGITSAAVAVLPCKPDLRQLRFEVQHTRIADPALAQSLLGWRAKRGIDEMCADAWRWQSANPEGYPD